MKILLTIILNLGFNLLIISQNSCVLTKDKTIELYKTLYLSSEIDSIIWNGNIKKCFCGTLKSDIYQKAQDRINFFRVMNGLTEVKINSKFNKEAQEAALLIKANNQLTHYPNKSMECYTELASNGCKKSCLSLTDYKNFPSTAFITGFIWDFGESNYFVGHRRWILYSRLKEFGYGATNNSEAILTVDGVSYDSIALPEFIAYPWNGYVPFNLIFPKWSFSIPETKKVDFKNTIILMTDEIGKEIQIEKLKERKNFLDNTVVWIAKDLFTDSEIAYGQNKLEEKGYLNKKIKVQIKNVVIDGVNKDFEYFVEPIKY